MWRQRREASSAWAVCPPHIDMTNQRNWLIRKFMKAGFSVTSNHSLCSPPGSGPSDATYWLVYLPGERERRIEQREKPNFNARLRQFLRELWSFDQITPQTCPTLGQMSPTLTLHCVWATLEGCDLGEGGSLQLRQSLLEPTAEGGLSDALPDDPLCFVYVQQASLPQEGKASKTKYTCYC